VISRKIAALAVAVFILSFCRSLKALSLADTNATQVSQHSGATSSSSSSHLVVHRRRRHYRRHHAAHRASARRTTGQASSTAHSSRSRYARTSRRYHHYRRMASRTVTYRRVTYTRYRRLHHYRRHYWSPWSVSSYSDPSLGDDPEGENPVIRQAAIQALGHWNGSVVVVNPNNGRILTIVNQKLAVSRGYIPCSTVKPMVALAALREGIITLNTKLPGADGRRIDLTQALAHSDNRFFARLGELLGFERVERYASELGYGQKATLDITDESPGAFPAAPPPKKAGGVGLLTSFGTGIEQTPLQMAAIVSAIANGGMLYWLQFPRTTEEIEHFEPRVRRELTDLMPYIPDLRQGMAAAVLYGTARAAYNPDEGIFGKTGTCSEDGGRMGWFVSYSEEQRPQYVVIVMLRGGRPMYGPHAAEIAGVLYRSLLPKGIESAQAGRPHLPTLIEQPGQ
jgi:penicillin-binding protein 2